MDIKSFYYLNVHIDVFYRNEIENLFKYPTSHCYCTIVTHLPSSLYKYNESIYHRIDLKHCIQKSDAPKPIGPYNQAVQINYMIYLSGQIGINPATGQLVSDDVRNQTQQAFINIKAVLNAAGADLNQIARCLVLLTDMNDFQSVNQIYASFFPSTEDYPARSTFAVKTLPANAKVEIECTAYTMKE
ncbi:unnamed protein product [Rotaria magnacalcarata]